MPDIRNSSLEFLVRTCWKPKIPSSIRLIQQIKFLARWPYAAELSIARLKKSWTT